MLRRCCGSVWADVADPSMLDLRGVQFFGLIFFDRKMLMMNLKSVRGTALVAAVGLALASVVGVSAASVSAAVDPVSPWGPATEIPSLEALAVGDNFDFFSVSCAAPGECSAVGDYIDGDDNYQGFVVSQVAGVWGEAIDVPGLIDLNVGGDAAVQAVSCAGVGTCAVVGYFADSYVGGFDQYTYAGFVADLSAGADLFVPLTPDRVLNTRGGVKVGNAAGTAAARVLKVTGVGGVPSSGVGAVVLNVTATNTEDPTIGGGYVTVYPCGESLPDTSNLNFVGGQTVANSVVAPVSADGEVCFYVYGTAHLLADVSGYFPVLLR